MKLSRFQTVLIALLALLVPLVLFIAVSILSSKPITKAEVPGVYVANFGNEPELIEVKSDGTYIHHCSLNGKELSNSNKWTFDEDRAHMEVRLAFEKFTMGSAWPLRYIGKSGFWLPELYRSGGNLQLNVSDDENLYFEKKDDSR